MSTNYTSKWYQGSTSVKIGKIYSRSGALAGMSAILPLWISGLDWLASCFKVVLATKNPNRLTFEGDYIYFKLLFDSKSCCFDKALLFFRILLLPDKEKSIKILKIKFKI